ncbi:succinate semialdehyde dehydrogenase [Mycena rosella]|uniref:Succinate semialdehyde dehydrogenase n=1 Tax=Mycena rosella TaxID=1033263 RepID=A0AAD7G5Q2_MYCRO|nr:succinate semialdehyde dehydrogenase [Mycena rosella]
MAAQVSISPHDLQPYCQRIQSTPEELDAAIVKSAAAQKEWAALTLEERIAIMEKFIEEFINLSARIPNELCKMMGRPISQGAGEVRGFLERAKYLVSIAASSLADVGLQNTDKPGFRRFIKRVPHGVVLVIAPWNFPYLTSINSVLPALLAGNTVLFKPSPQTPLMGERLSLAFHRAGVPKDAIITLNLSTEGVTQAIQHPLVNFVSFTGSVPGGREVEKAAVNAPGFKGVALELGGKDPAYVRSDADLDYTAAELVDGAFFNSGQSCCAVERIYVHEAVYDEFVAKFVEIVKAYKLGDPYRTDTTLGPVISLASANRIRKQVTDAVEAGAKTLIDPYPYRRVAKPDTAFVVPQVLVDVNHTMDVMKEETFGPVVGIQKVASDEEAVQLMNDSPYGLTASIWTNAEANPASEEAFLALEAQLECGTVFLNRCDYLDPALAWTGVKDSGRGISLSKFGFDQLTRAKSVHMKIKTSVDPPAEEAKTEAPPS